MASHTTLPGFTAEASLNRTHTTYHTQRNVAPTAAVIPQLRRPTWPRDCIPGCICVSPIGCPCCSSVDPTWPFDPIFS